MSPEVIAMLKRILNGYLIFFISLVPWHIPLQMLDGSVGGANPLLLLLGAGACMIVIDLSNYEENPTIKGVAWGVLLAPFWIFMRTFIKRENRD